ncbi:hypothetical protein [Halorussus caseinilyticus]|uniref:Uncharacterized protein n=1 Tax=Halorussus caseinilyticus TaxID=3034025 RepID=A0ABD5WI26_9EURY
MTERKVWGLRSDGRDPAEFLGSRPGRISGTETRQDSPRPTADVSAVGRERRDGPSAPDTFRCL